MACGDPWFPAGSSPPPHRCVLDPLAVVVIQDVPLWQGLRSQEYPGRQRGCCASWQQIPYLMAEFGQPPGQPVMYDTGSPGRQGGGVQTGTHATAGGISMD